MGDPGDLAAKRAEQLIAWASDLLRADGYSAATQQAIADAVR
jgi:DNA-directed RNA polymerase subunit K/omega